MQTLAAVLTAFPALKWRTDTDTIGAGAGAGTAYAIVGGDKSTGEIYVFAVIQRATAPRHFHRPGGDYGEKIGTFAGALHDYDDDGNRVTVGPNDLLIHGPGTTHAPWADFWFGYYHQPRGSELVRDPGAEQKLA